MFDLNTSEGRYYITMEYVSGQDLKGLIRQSGRLAVETAVSIALQVCNGLEEAHAQGIVHRDLKPGNIMVDRDGQARIIPKKKAFTSREITVTVGVKKLIVPAIALFALAAIAVVLWKVIPIRKAAPVPTDKPSVAILDFKNNTGDAGLVSRISETAPLCAAAWP